MPNAIDNAIARVQDIVGEITGIEFKSAPDYPIENADPFPMSIAYVGGGQFYATNATVHHNFPALVVEFHFSRVNLKQTYQQINSVILEFPRRIVADPTLAGNVTTVVMTQDQPIQYSVRPFQFGKVMSQMLMYTIPIKTLQTPLT